MPVPGERRIRFSVESGTARRVAIAAVAVFCAIQVLAWSFGALSTLLFDLLLAWLIAVSVDPLIERLTRRGMSRGAATGVVIGSATVAFLGIAALLGGALISQLGSLLRELPDLASSAAAWSNDTLGTDLDPDHLIDGLNLSGSQVANLTSQTAGGLLTVFGRISGAVFELVTVVVFSCYFASGAPSIKRVVASWLPTERQTMFLEVWDISVRKAGGFVISKVALAAVSSVAHIVAFWAIGVPYWLPMGLFAGIVSQFIPVVGTYVGVAVPALFCVLVDPWDAVWVIAFATVYQQVENYLLQPRVAAATMDLNGGVALAAVIGGAALFGPVGALIGMPLAAIVIAVTGTYWNRFDLHPEVEAATAPPPGPQPRP